MNRTLYFVLVKLVLIGLCLTPLVIAVGLEPDHRGHGTHEQMGLEPCGYLVETGRPCPTCGMTTAFANTVRLRLPSAFAANPGGLFLALVCMAIPIYIVDSWRRRLPASRFFQTWLGRRWLIISIAVLLLGWIIKLQTFAG